MIPGHSLFWHVVLPPVALGAFMLPGWLASRRLGSPAPLLTAFLLSAALWFHLVLACELVGLRLDRSSLIGGWSILCLLSVALARRTAAPGGPGGWEHFKPRGSEWVWAAVAAIGLASITVRAIVDPLSGWDNLFRWDYLARAIIVHGDLNFYPPVRAVDFEVYSWCDGIPPLVPLLNLWVYIVTGVMNPAITAVRISGESVLIGMTVFGLGREFWGPRAGWPAVALLGTSALFLWGVAMGQETGLLALTLLALLWLLERHHRDHLSSSVFWAGLAAGVGALSRDYGLAFPLLGFVILAVQRPRPKTMMLFVVTAIAVAGPWYLRNWVRTGNPVFPLALGGLFPANPAYSDIMLRIRNVHSLAPNHINFGLLAQTLVIIAGAALAAGLAGVALARRRSSALLAAFLLTIGLWLWSVPWTAGGLNYSLRVLTPAIALCAVLGGWLGNLPPGVGRAAVLTAVLIFSCDAARRAWLLPVFPRVPPIPWTFEDWRLVRLDIHHVEENPLWNYVVATADGGLIAVDNPNAHVALVNRGGRTSMLFSPVLAGCFDPAHPFADTVRQLREKNVRLFVLSIGDRVAMSFIAAHPFFETLRSRYRPLIEVQSVAVYDLDKLQPVGP